MIHFKQAAVLIQTQINFQKRKREREGGLGALSCFSSPQHKKPFGQTDNSINLLKIRQITLYSSTSSSPQALSKSHTGCGGLRLKTRKTG